MTAWRRELAILLIVLAVLAFAFTVVSGPLQPHLRRPSVLESGQSAVQRAGRMVSAGVTPATSGGIVKSIPVGKNPDALAYDSVNRTVYVGNAGSSNVSVINASKNQVTDTVPVAGIPTGIAYDPSNGYVYVANEGGNNVTVIDSATNDVLGTIPVGDRPYGIIADTATGNVYVANQGGTNVTVIGGSSDKVVGSVPVGTYPQSIAFDSDNGYLYVTNFESGNVSVIDGATNTIVGSIFTDDFPYGIAFDGRSGDVYVVNGMNLTVINGIASVASIDFSVGGSPNGAAFDSYNGYVYVVGYASAYATVIETSNNTIVASIPVGVGTENPWAIAYDSANSYLYAANPNNNSVAVINGSFFYPAISSYTASPANITLGVTTNLSVTATGGAGALSYAYTGLPAGCVSSDTPRLSCTPSAVGSYSIRAFVNDTMGNSVNSVVSLRVSPLPTVSIEATPNPTDAHSPVDFAASPSGGTAPFAYAWLFGDGTRAAGQNPTHVYNLTGTYVARVYANDSFGYSNTTTSSITVDSELSDK